MILGKRFFVSPSDSVAVIAANATSIPFFQDGLKVGGRLRPHTHAPTFLTRRARARSGRRAVDADVASPGSRGQACRVQVLRGAHRVEVLRQPHGPWASVVTTPAIPPPSTADAASAQDSKELFGKEDYTPFICGEERWAPLPPPPLFTRLVRPPPGL